MTKDLRILNKEDRKIRQMYFRNNFIRSIYKQGQMIWHNPQGLRTQSYFEAYYQFVKRFHRDRSPMTVNTEYLVKAHYHQEEGRGGYFAPESGTSEGQFVTMKGLLYIYELLGEKKYLDLAEGMAQATLKYLHKGAETPTQLNLDNLVIPHWLYNPSEPFNSETIYLNRGCTFNSGVGVVQTPGPFRKVFSVRRHDATLDWPNPFADVVGVEYEVDNYVVDGNQATIYLTDTNISENAFVVCTDLTGPVVEHNELYDAWPVWHKLREGQAACAIDSLFWGWEAFHMLHNFTGNEEYQKVADYYLLLLEYCHVVEYMGDWISRDGLDDNPLSDAGTYFYTERFGDVSISRHPSQRTIQLSIPSGEELMLFGRSELDRYVRHNSSILCEIGSDTPNTVMMFLAEDIEGDFHDRWFTFLDLNGTGLQTFNLDRTDFFKIDHLYWDLNRLPWIPEYTKYHHEDCNVTWRERTEGGLKYLNITLDVQPVEGWGDGTWSGWYLTGWPEGAIDDMAHHQQMTADINDVDDHWWCNDPDKKSKLRLMTWFEGYSFEHTGMYYEMPDYTHVYGCSYWEDDFTYHWLTLYYTYTYIYPGWAEFVPVISKDAFDHMYIPPFQIRVNEVEEDSSFIMRVVDAFNWNWDCVIPNNSNWFTFQPSPNDFHFAPYQTNITEYPSSMSFPIIDYKFICVPDYDPTEITNPNLPPEEEGVTEPPENQISSGFVDFDLRQIGNITPMPADTWVDTFGFQFTDPTEQNVEVGTVRLLPREGYDYNPYVTPFTLDTLYGRVAGWRGSPYTGYQMPWYWFIVNNPQGLETNLQFMEDAQDAYYQRTGVDGFFAPVFLWDRWDSREYGPPNTWSWNGPDPNTFWGGFQMRSFEACAKTWMYDPSNTKVANIVMRFLRGVKEWWVGDFPLTTFPEDGPPIGEYMDTQAVALQLRGALYAYQCATDPEDEALAWEIAERSKQHLDAHFVQPPEDGLWEDGDIGGTWGNPNEAMWYMYWGGEINIAYVEWNKYKTKG